MELEAQGLEGRDLKQEIERLDDLRQKLDTYFGLASVASELSWEVYTTTPQKYRYAFPISWTKILHRPRYVFPALLAMTDNRVRRIVAAEQKAKRYKQANFRPDHENGWFNIVTRLNHSFGKWSTVDDEAANTFRNDDPLVMDAKEGECRRMVDPQERVARVTQPELMALDYLDEYLKIPIGQTGRLGWDLLVKDAGVWFRRAIFDAGFDHQQHPFFVLDTNRYLGETLIPSGRAGVAKTTHLETQMVRRFPPTGVTRTPSDYQGLPIIDSEMVKDYFIVLPDPNNPPA